MPKASCRYEGRRGEYVTCNITKELCGHVKYCRTERRWKLSDTAINCTVPKKEGKNGK